MSEDKVKILIIDDLHPCFFEQREVNGFDITYSPDIKPADIQAALEDKHVLVLRSKVFVNEALCKNANALKLIARAGSGLDNLDTDWLDKNGIKYINTPEANSQAVAEQCLGMLLSLMSNIVKADREVRNDKWDREGNRGDELEGKTLGIIGYGNTGSRFAKLLGGFDVKVLAYDKYISGFGSTQVREANMNEMLAEADILSLHVPLTSETTFLVNSDFISLFAKPFRLLNLSRGGVVKTGDVVKALETKKIIGFATDVLENERINQLNNSEQAVFNSLRSLPNVVLTPHIGGWTRQSYERISVSLALKISAFFKHPSALERGFKEAQKFP